MTEPKFVAEVEKELKSTPIPQWRTYLEWQVLNAAADTLSEPFVEENFAFNGKYLTGATEMKPRWKRCAEATDNQLGEALGQAYVEKYFPPEAKARMQDMVKNILLAMKDTINGLDWMSAGHQEEGAREARDVQPEDRLSGQVEGLQRRRRSRARRTGTTSSPRRAGTSTTTARRSASRSTAAAGA